MLQQRENFPIPKKGSGKISALLPDSIDFDSFYSSLILNIATVNKNPTGTTSIGSKLGKKQRSEYIQKGFKTLGDYTPNKYEESLVVPTINRFASSSDPLERKQIAFNNNNVSHTERLGLIKKLDSKHYQLTQLGEVFQKDD